MSPNIDPTGTPSRLFPYRARPGQDSMIAAIDSVTRTGGSLVVNAPTGLGKTVAALAPLLEHAERADHTLLYLVRTHSQEVKVVQEIRAITHRMGRPPLVVGLAGRSSRCLLLANEAFIKDATAEEHGLLCADRKRATQARVAEGTTGLPSFDLPEGGVVDLVDLDGCAYYARVLQTDVEGVEERLVSKTPTPTEFDTLCASENLCPYELAKRLLPRARVVTAPYAFFFHPFVHRALLRWLGRDPSRIDLVIDEAHQIPGYLRELTSVTLPLSSVRRARGELTNRDFQLPDGPSASHFFDIVHAAIDELVQSTVRDDDALLPPNVLEDALLTALGGTSQKLDRWLGALATWGETLKEERRKARKLPRSWVQTVALTLLSWPQLDGPEYAKLVTRSPRPALEAFSLDPAKAATPITECHLALHMSGTLDPLLEYRESLGLPEATPLLEVPSPFPANHVKFLFDPGVTTQFEVLRSNPEALPQLADRIGASLQALPVKTAVFFPSFDLLDRVLKAGLQTQLPPKSIREHPHLSSGDLWRSVDGFKSDRGAGAILGVIGGRVAEGIDFPDQELEAVILVGIPYPRPTARRDALRQYLDHRTGRGWAYAYEAVARRGIAQAYGRMIRSANDRGIVLVLDRRAVAFRSVLPGLEPVGDLAATARAFYGRRPRWSTPVVPSPSPRPSLDPES